MNVPARQLITMVHDGDTLGWNHELEWLWTEDRDRMLRLIDDITTNGIREPVRIGVDEDTGILRVWDGHHRIAAALALNLDVPVTYTIERYTTIKIRKTAGDNDA